MATVTGTVVVPGLKDLLLEAGFTINGRWGWVKAPSGNDTGFHLVGPDRITGEPAENGRAYGFDELVRFIVGLKAQGGSRMAISPNDEPSDIYVFRRGQWCYDLYAVFEVPVGETRLRKQLAELGGVEFFGGEALRP